MAGTAALALTATAHAQTTVTLEPIVAACADGLAVADHNGDGWISRAEAESAMIAHFELLDGDADGAVTLSEFTACRAGSGLRTTTRRTAVLSASHPLFAADLDRNKAIDRMEWNMAAERLYYQMPMSGGRADGATFDGAMAGFALLSVQADTDGDGVIGTIEAGNAIRQGYILADVNGDGLVTFAEFATRDMPSEVTEVGPNEAAVKQLSQLWYRLDGDGDGYVTFTEFRDAGLVRFVAAANAAGSDPDVAVPVSAVGQIPVM
jgi:Ca2+-binding EF-hand superfamily protein